MKSGLIKITIISILFSSCSIPGKFTVTAPDAMPQEFLSNTIYVLPRTSFLVTVEFEKETRIAGPYGKYSERLLGVTAPITESGVKYKITGTEVVTFSEPDPAHYYSINHIKGKVNFETLTSLVSAGFVLNPSAALNYPHQKMIAKTKGDELWFGDMSISLNLKEVTDTLYKTMLMDSSYVRIPVVRKQEMAKTIDQKAEETAKFIVRIRNRRFRLLSGEYDIFPEGKALEISVRELDQLEKEYLELFMGKTIRESYSRSFLVSPESASGTERIVFAKFSDEQGLIEPGINMGTEMTLVIDPLKTTQNLEWFEIPTGKAESFNSLIYRIPDNADVKVLLGSNELYLGRFSVYQSGKIVGIKQSGR